MTTWHAPTEVLRRYATGAIDDPTVEMDRALKYHANRRSRRTSRDPDSVTAGPRSGRHWPTGWLARCPRCGVASRWRA